MRNFAEKTKNGRDAVQKWIFVNGDATNNEIQKNKKRKKRSDMYFKEHNRSYIET